MLILSEAQVRQCLSIESCVAVNRIALGALSRFHQNESESDRGIDRLGHAVVPKRIALPRCLEHQERRGLMKPDIIASKVVAIAPVDTTLFKPGAFYFNANLPVSKDQNGNSDDTHNHQHNQNIMGIKVVSVRSKNQSIGKPTVPATITMIHPETGEVTAVLGATYLTAARTAAGSAIATKLCTDYIHSTQRSGDKIINTNAQNHSHTPKHLVVFGAGLQAEMHIRCLHHILPGQIHNVTILNRSIERAEALQQMLLNDPHTCNLNCEIATLDDERFLQNTVQRADIIVTAINCSEPLFDWNWVGQKNEHGYCHINGVGSYLPESEEVSAAFVQQHCGFVVDSMDALQVGDLKGVNEDSDNFMGVLGDLLQQTDEDDGPMPMPDSVMNDTFTSKYRCTFFKSVGTAVQDIVTADDVIKTAMRLGIGTNVDI